MLRRLLLSLVVLTSFQFTNAQAPGPDCTAPVPLTLVPGGTVNTGLQSLAGLGNDLVPGEATINNLGLTGEDGVYEITVVNGGPHIFEFLPTLGVNSWSTVSVHSACPESVANFEGGFTTFTQIFGSVTINLTPGTYFVVVDNFTGVGTGMFDLQITAPIANDDCSGAIELFSSVSCSYQTETNAGAGDSGVPAPGACANYLGGDVWFSYEVNSSGEFTIDLDDSGDMDDSGLAVYTGTCGSLTLLECDDADSSNGNMSTITRTGLTEGDIVYIRVWADGNINNGTFDICITTPIPPGDTGVYDDCPGAQSAEITTDFVCPPDVVASTTITGNLFGQPTANRINTTTVETDPCAFAAGQPRRWEGVDFTVSTTGTYTFETDASTGWDNMGYIVESGFTPGNCGSGVYIAGDDDSGVAYGLAAGISTNLVAGTTYTFITTEWAASTANRPYTWNVSGPGTFNLTGIPPVDWYISDTGGSPIASGPGFNPINVPGSGLTDTSAPGIYSFWYACSLTPAVRTQVDYVIGKVWVGGTDSDWNNPANWSNDPSGTAAVPTASQCIVIPAPSAGTVNPVVNDDDIAEALNLTIEPGATLTLSSDTGGTADFASALVVQDYIDNQGTLTVQDGANLIQVNDSPAQANSGNINLTRTANIRQTDYVYWSSPVENFPVTSVYGGSTPTNRIYEWIPTTAAGVSFPGSIPVQVGNWSNVTSGNMSEGKGYIIQGPASHPAGPAPINGTFTGVPNNGVITQALSSGNYTGIDLQWQPNAPANLDVVTYTDNDDNWNLVGNPYPSSLDADAFLSANALIDGAVHIWTHGTEFGDNGDSFYNDFAVTYDPNDYITYNLSGGTMQPFSGNIASGQGFFVLALNNNETGSVTFNNSMRQRGATPAPFSNTDFYRLAQSPDETTGIERHRIWLDLISNATNTSSNILVGYIEGATQEKDRLYDAFARDVNSLSLYSMINGEGMIIQGRALPFLNTDTVPLGVVLPEVGDYTIAISGVDGLFLDNNQNIFLEDTYTGVIHDLKATPFTFSIDENNMNLEDRFVLRYTDEQLSVDEFDMNTVNVFTPNSKYIRINSEQSAIKEVVLFDLLGRTLLNKNNLNSMEFSTENNSFDSGAYIVQITLENGLTKTQKVILRQ